MSKETKLSKGFYDLIKERCGHIKQTQLDNCILDYLFEWCRKGGTSPDGWTVENIAYDGENRVWRVSMSKWEK